MLWNVNKKAISSGCIFYKCLRFINYRSDWTMQSNAQTIMSVTQIQHKTRWENILSWSQMKYNKGQTAFYVIQRYCITFFNLANNNESIQILL